MQRKQQIHLHNFTRFLLRREDRRLNSKAKKTNKNTLKSNNFLETIRNISIQSPKAICIYHDKYREKTISFINLIKKSIFSKKKVFIDFHQIQYCSAAGTLLLLSTIDDSIRKSGKRIKVKLPESDKISSVFKQTGLGDVLSRKITIKNEYPDVSFWNFTTETQVDGEKTGGMIEKLIGKIHSSNHSKLFSSLQEGISNSVEHAYKHLNRSSLSRVGRWWGFGGVYNNQAVLLICDLGLGIPRTLQKELSNGWVQRALSLFGGQYIDHGDLILAATNKGKSQTKQKNRGYGLAEICKFIEETPNSSLSIYSNRGSLNIKTRELSDRKVRRTAGHKNSINGTIIEWSIPLEENENESSH